MPEDFSPLTPPLSAGFLQFDVRLGEPTANLAAVRRGLERLAPTGPGLIVLPELWSCGFAGERIRTFAAETDQILAELTRLAATYRLHLAGSLPEAAGDGTEAPIYNSLFIVGPTGVCGSYRKQQLFAPMAEDAHFRPGADPLSIQTALGLIGALVCYDLRFPELARHQAGLGAGLLAVSAQWPMARLAHWRALLIARAIENQIFVVAGNRCGRSGETVFCGHSLVIAPDGTVLAEAGEGEEALLVGLDSAQLDEVRRRFNTVGPRPCRLNDRDKVLSLAELVALAALGCVDHVVIFDEETPQRLINALTPEVLVKGGDWPVEKIVGAAEVLAAGGRVLSIPLVGDCSTTALIEKIRNGAAQ